MPQVSLYVSESILKKIETAAKLEKKSISKWVSEKLDETLKRTWPRTFSDLFGSIQNDTFDVDAGADSAKDTPRATL